MDPLKTYARGTVLVAQFNRERPSNPLNRALEAAIVEVCRETETDAGVHALVLTGGEGRSFCVGDDFHEAKELRTPAAIEELIDRIIRLYVAILAVTKPTIAALDGYAIGGGIQMALACDWRLGTPQTKVASWELKHGIGCPLGGYMLETFFGRASMVDVICRAETLPCDWAHEHRFLNEVVEPNQLTERAIARAQVFAAYPDVPFRHTKAAVNRSFISGLLAAAPVAKAVHVGGFLSGAADAHFRRVLKQ